MKRLTVFSLIILCALLALPANTTVQANPHTSDAAFVADVTVPDDTVFAPGERFDNGFPSLLGHPQQDEPIDPEVSPAGSPEPGDVINNIAQHVAEGLAEGERYEVRAIDEAVMFRDKAAWDSGETAKQTGWWEVIRAEADFLLGKDSQGNEFWVSANGDSEATHLDTRPATSADEDLGEGEDPVKDVTEPQVTGGQTGISIDYERLKEKVSLKDGQLCMDVNDLYHSLTTKGDNVQVLLENGKLSVLIGENGEIFIKSRAWYSDGRTIDIWTPAYAFEDNQLSKLSNATVSQLSGFQIVDKRLDLVEEKRDLGPLPELPENEEQEIARRSSLNGVIPNKINAFMVGGKLVDSFWMRGIVNKGYNYGEGNRAEVKGLDVLVDEAYPDPKENSPDFILGLNAKSYGDNHTVLVVNGPEKTMKVRIDGRYFTMFRLLRNPSNNDPIRVEQIDWVLGDFFGADVSFYLTDEEWGKIMRFLANPSAKELEFRADSGLVSTH